MIHFIRVIVIDEKEDLTVAACSNSQSVTMNTSSLSGGLQANRNKAPVSPIPSSTSIKTEPDIKPIHALSNDRSRRSIYAFHGQ